MSNQNQNPPKYPLLEAESPFCCKIREEDSYILTDAPGLKNVLTLPSDLNTQKKRRSTEEPFQQKQLNNEIKRRLTLRDEDIQEGIIKEYQHDIDDRADEEILEVTRITPNELLEDPMSNIEIDQQPQQTQQQQQQQQQTQTQQQQQQPVTNGIKEYENSELPLPSPSASPAQSAYDETHLLTPEPLLTTSSDVVNFIENFATTSLSKSSVNSLIFKLLSSCDRSVLSDFRNTIDEGLKRDIISNLPLELSYKVMKFLDYKSLNNILLVSKKWNNLITGEFWKNLLIKDNLITPEELFSSNFKKIENPSYYQSLYIKRFELLKNWTDPTFEPKKITVAGHGPNVVTCLQFDDEKIISGADDHMINIYNPDTGELIKSLSGHEGGVWALKYVGNQIVSGSTDRTVRVWNLQTGKCTHIFKGHTSTIRCMEIVTIEETGEKLIITGSRDSTLHVWKLPNEDDQGEDFNENDVNNPYFVCVLRGHTASVRAVTGHGNLVVSGSYDHTVRVWDLKERKCKFTLQGHSDRIYSTLLDLERNRCISASMDSSIKVWDLSNGECIADLTRHTSLVGLLGLSSNYLVSAAADGTLRGWNPTSYKNEFTLHHDNHAAITTFHASPNLLVSGSENQFNVYDLRQKGKLIRSHLLPDAGQIWSTRFNHSKCIVAVEKNSQSFIEILDFSKSA
ncbi:putative WD repeat-containing protein [Wickerhamomyces ciferrii]|uniref:WD repeat-containing protein n=1 Tax=Wickerhamomyces ciferrii (strain ATCC 14091 / BCRC 22168 / CBS 111 / JCM 3599 / NBRC 0793 / NRRL Y-1031 F-60-10) TaxID=1206466 RepID=K0KI20_WICCF|nr:putative WD repeat-containing protein [Wickerhamomyces ciferrii]CCH41802.1 putative WD repeat-containing protein [Wickerhamomyces ciferrii]